MDRRAFIASGSALALMAGLKPAGLLAQGTGDGDAALNALFVQHADTSMLRAELYRLTTSLKRMGVTIVFTGERTDDYGQVTRFGIEEFVADNVVILRNVLADEKRRRTMEILKFRGARHERWRHAVRCVDRALQLLVDGPVAYQLLLAGLPCPEAPILASSGQHIGLARPRDAPGRRQDRASGDGAF